MTDTVILNAELRETGSKKAAEARAKGLLPAVIYGHKQTPESVAIDYKAITDGLHHGHRLFEIKFDGKSEVLLVKDIQYDYLGKDLIHIDFVRVNLDEKAVVSVPLVIKGTAKGISEGGVLDMHMDHIDINCPVTTIPESFTVKVKSLGIGDSVVAKDIALPNNAELVTDPEAVLVNCHYVTEKPEIEEELEEGEEAAEPEVITEKNRDEEE